MEMGIQDQGMDSRPGISEWKEWSGMEWSQDVEGQWLYTSDLR